MYKHYLSSDQYDSKTVYSINCVKLKKLKLMINIRKSDRPIVRKTKLKNNRPHRMVWSIIS